MTSQFFRRLGNLRKRSRDRSWQPAFEGLEKRLVFSAPGGGYTPAQIVSAYGFNQIRGLTGSNYNEAGAGQTIAIFQFGNDANIRSDLGQFDEQYQIGGTAGNSADTDFLSVVNAYGGSTLPPASEETPELAIEQSIDVEWAHAIAPGAKILVIDTDVFNGPGVPVAPLGEVEFAAAIQYATSQPDVSVVSFSYSFPIPNELAGQTLLDGLLTTPAGHQGISFVAATGDNGGATYPSTSPNVLAVGGTELPADAAGNPDRADETGWDNSGGGSSLFEGQPQYQQGIVTQSTTNRTTPDVAFNAAGPGFSLYDSFGNPASPWTTGGGTSNAAPCWAGLIAIADQLRAAHGLDTLDGPTQLLPALYQIDQTDPNAFQDITTGSTGYNSAGAGYDLVTGLGTPNAQYLVPDLVAARFTPASPATVYWTGDAGDDSWNDPGNWSDTDPLHGNGPDGVLPGANDNVVIDKSGQTINFSSASLQFQNSTPTGPFLTGSASVFDTIRSLNITGQNDTLDLADGVLDLSGGGPLGTFAARQAGDSVIMGGVVPGIGNAPYTNLPDPVGGVLRNALVSAGTAIVIPGGSEGVLEGGVLEGTVQAQSGSSLQLLGNWTNNGTITVAAGSLVNLGEFWAAGLDDPGATAAAWVNHGVITTSDDTLFLGGWLTNTNTSFPSVAGLATDTVDLYGTLDNVGGKLVLSPGVSSVDGNWYLVGGRIDGGTVTESNGALLIPKDTLPPFPAGAYGTAAGNSSDGYANSILDDITLNGDLDVSAFVVILEVDNGITLNGDLNLEGSGSETLCIGGRMVITGDVNAIGSDVLLSMSDVHARFDGALDFDNAVAQFEFSGGSLTVKGTATLSGEFSTIQFSDANRVTFDGDVVLDSAVATFSDVAKVVINQDFDISGFDCGAAFSDGSNLVLRGTLDVSAEGGVVNFDGTDPQSITGTGTIDLDGNPGDGVYPDDRDFLYDAGAQTLTIGRGITINSTGTRNEIIGPIDNEGTIQSSANVLLINFGLVSPGSSSAPVAWVNRGTIAATTAGSTLSLGGAWTNDGTITAAPAALLFLGDQWNALPLASYADATQDAWVNHGTITAVNANVGLGGWLSFAPKAANLATLNLGTDGIEVGGTLDNRGRTLTLAPGVTSTTGRWALDGGAILGGTVATTGGATLAATPAGGTLDGVTVAGTLDMSRFSDSVLTLLDGLTLLGSLQVGIGSSVNGAITNLGTIADEISGGSLSLSGPITNRGTVTVGAGSSFSTSASYTQLQGLTTVDGTLTATTVVIDGGTLDGSGTVMANLTNAGTVAPGDPGSTGTLTVQGNYTQTGTGVIVIALGSASSSQLAVSGGAALAGTFAVTVLPGFVPTAGASYTPLTFSTRTGQFATMTGLNLGGGVTLVSSYSGDDLVLVVQIAKRPTPVGH